MAASDWPQVRAIYLEGIATHNATFETEAPSWEKWNAGHLDKCRLVARQDGQVLGWAALSPVSSRCVYAGVAEVSVYVAEAARGNGAGKSLLKELVRQSERPESGPCKPEFSLRTRPALRSIKPVAFAKWECAKSLARWGTAGEMWCCWRGEASESLRTIAEPSVSRFSQKVLY